MKDEKDRSQKLGGRSQKEKAFIILTLILTFNSRFAHFEERF
jgi:hypothetical protein